MSLPSLFMYVLKSGLVATYQFFWDSPEIIKRWQNLSASEKVCWDQINLSLSNSIFSVDRLEKKKK